jgi:hypothetical protein
MTTELMRRHVSILAIALCCLCCISAQAQTAIYGEVRLDQFDFNKERNYCVRLFGYYRTEDDGRMQMADREKRLYRIHEGICAMDVRYKKDYDDGAVLIVGRNLVHPEQEPDNMSFYELTPYNFLEKARKDEKHFSIQTHGDSSRVYVKKELVGTAVADTVKHELRMRYNALAPDTALSINLLILSAKLTNVMADAVYRMEDNDIRYVPQGDLKYIVFEGDISMEVHGSTKANLETFHERTEFYVDSVIYMTKTEYKADKKLTTQQRAEKTHYSVKDIDRLKQKLNVPPLSRRQRVRIEEQRDWEDQYAQMKEADKTTKAIEKATKKAAKKK